MSDLHKTDHIIQFFNVNNLIWIKCNENHHSQKFTYCGKARILIIQAIIK